MGLKINKLSKVKGTFSGTSVDPILTSNASTGVVDTAAASLGALASGKIWIGSAGNAPVAQTFSGAITVNTSGVTTLTAIVNANVSASAAITLTKLAATTASRSLVSDASGFISPSATTSTEIGYVSGVTSAIQTQLNSKQATITGAATSVVSSNLSANIVVVSDGSGKITSSAVTTTALGYIATLSSAAQTQLNTKLTTSLGSVATGDIIYYNGSAWTNLARGTVGQVLQSTAGSIQWATGTANGLPIGGTTGQYLNKIDGTNYNAQWSTLTLSKITDVSATASEVNKLSGVTTTTAQLNYLNTATNDIQSQLNNKLANSLANNALFVGNTSNVPSVLAPGSNGQVLQITAGVPSWQTISGTGTVTSVDVSGGTTGLTTSGGPIATSGTITLAGTLVAVNGGTGQSAVATGDLLYGSATNTWSRLNAGTNGYILTLVGGLPAWQANSGGTSTLTNNHIFVGNGSNVATDVAMSQDATIVASGALTVVGIRANSIPTLSNGALYWTGSAFQWNNVYPTTFTTGSVIFMGAVQLSQDNSNFFWNTGSHILSVNTNGDQTGVDSINVYNEVDAYKPNSSQGAIGSGTESGFTFSTSRGTGASPTVVSSGDLLGGVSGWGYTGSSPAYTALAGMWATAQGAASTLGGKLDFQTRADGGALTSRLTIDNTGSVAITAFGTAGIVHNNSSGVLTSSLIGASDLTTNLAWLVGGNTLTGTAVLGDISGTGFTINFQTKATTRLFIDGAGNFGITQGAQASGWAPTVLFTPGAHTAYTANTEFIDYDFAARNVQWAASSTVATQRFAYFRGATVNQAGATATLTDAFTVFIDPPVAGTATITRKWALGLGGNIQVAGNVLLKAGTTAQIGTSDSQSLQILTNGTNRVSINNTGGWAFSNGTTTGTSTWMGFTQSAATSGIPTGLLWTAAAHTNLTLNTEITDINFNLAAVLKMADGTVATQRAFRIQGRTYTPQTTALTITDAYTASVDPPAPGAGTTMTRRWALGLTGALQLYAGTTTMPPLAFQAGTNSTTIINGAMEFDGSHLTVAIGGSRFQLDQQVGGGGASITNLSVTTSTTLGTTASTIYNVFVDATSGNIAITLPTATATVIYNIKRIDSTANTVTFVGTIDGNSSYLGSTGLLPLNGFTIMNNGTNYYAM